jgi:protein SCO1/2
MKKISDSTKLLLSVIALFLIIIYSYQKTSADRNFKANEVKFNTVSGQQTLKNFSGKIVLLYFGFLSCPDVCPTTLSTYTKAIKELKPEELSKLQFIFVDVDPKRDSLQKLKEYTQYFHPSIVSFSASEEITRPFARYFGADFKYVELKSNLGYTVDHTTDIIVVNPDTNQIITNIHHGTNHKLMIPILNELITKSQKEIK